MNDWFHVLRMRCPVIVPQVKVTLSDSDQFNITSCVGCQYQLCLCANESRTFQWLITPTALGEEEEYELCRHSNHAILEP